MARGELPAPEQPPLVLEWNDARWIYDEHTNRQWRERDYRLTFGWDVRRRSYWAKKVWLPPNRPPQPVDHLGLWGKRWFHLHTFVRTLQWWVPYDALEQFVSELWARPLLARRLQLELLTVRKIDRSRNRVLTELLEPVFDQWPGISKAPPRGFPGPYETDFGPLALRGPGPQLWAGYDLRSQRYFVDSEETPTVPDWNTKARRAFDPEFEAPSSVTADFARVTTLYDLLDATWRKIDWAAEAALLPALRDEPIAVEAYYRRSVLRDYKQGLWDYYGERTSRDAFDLILDGEQLPLW